MGENGEDESEGRFEGMCDLPEPSGGSLIKTDVLKLTRLETEMR